MKKNILLGSLCALLVAGSLWAGIVTKPTTFVNGTIADASQVNANYDTLYTLVNGNIDNANVKAAAGIVFSKLDSATVVGVTDAQVLTSKTLTAPVINGTVTGTYTLGGTPTINSPTITSASLTSPTITGTPTAAGALWTNLGTASAAVIHGGTFNGTIGGTVPAAGKFTTLWATGKTTMNDDLTLDTGAAVCLDGGVNNCIYYNPTALYFDVGGSTVATLDASSKLELKLSGIGLTIPSAAKIRLDGTSSTGDTYILENPANTIAFYAGNTKSLELNSTGVNIDGGAIDGTVIGANSPAAGTFTSINFSGDFSVAATNKIYLDGGSNTYLYEPTGDRISFVTGGYNFVNFGVGPGGVGTTDMWFNNDINATATNYINWKGYNAGATQFRDLVIGNGKGAALAYFYGSASKRVNLYGELSLPDVDPPTANLSNRNGNVKAWAKIEVDVWGSATLLSSYNVSSITQHGGTAIDSYTDVTVYWNTDFASADYVVNCSTNFSTKGCYIYSATSWGPDYPGQFASYVDVRVEDKVRAIPNSYFYVIAIGDQ